MPSFSALLQWSGLVLCTTFGFRVAVAQAPSRDTSQTGMRGVVVTAIGDHPVEGAVITLAEANVSVTSSKTGTYQFAGIAPGAYTVKVRKIGFSPLDAQIIISARVTLEADLELGVASK